MGASKHARNISKLTEDRGENQQTLTITTEIHSQTFVFHDNERWLLLAIENEPESKAIASSENRQLLTESWSHGLALEVAKSEKGE